jgi:hypothetical protein
MVERPEFADPLLPMSPEILTAAKRAMIALAQGAQYEMELERALAACKGEN